MKKILLAAAVVTGFCGSLFAQSSELGDLTTWLQKYYCQQYNVPYYTSDDPRYAEAKMKGEGMFSMPVSAWNLQSEMLNKIRQEYPMPTDLQAAVKTLEDQKNAKYLALAQKYGYASIDELSDHIKTDPRLNPSAIDEEIRVIQNEWGTANAALTAAYREEFNKRWEAAVIEAIKRIQENAKVMNPKQ